MFHSENWRIHRRVSFVFDSFADCPELVFRRNSFVQHVSNGFALNKWRNEQQQFWELPILLCNVSSRAQKSPEITQKNGSIFFVDKYGIYWVVSGESSCHESSVITKWNLSRKWIFASLTAPILKVPSWS